MVAMVAILDFILAIFYLQAALILSTKFQVKWPFVQEQKRKINFQDGSQSERF